MNKIFNVFNVLVYQLFLVTWYSLEKSMKLHICSFSVANQYQTWNLLGLQSKQKKLHIYWLFWRINTQHLWNLCGSSHSFCVSSVISYTKDCGEKFQKVQKLIKKFSHQFLFSTQVDRKRPIHHHRDLTGISGLYYADA